MLKKQSYNNCVPKFWTTKIKIKESEKQQPQIIYDKIEVVRSETLVEGLYYIFYL